MNGTRMYHSRSEDRTEQRILEQATHVLAEGRGRTMQEIAEVSGIGRTTLYRYFRTREDLVAAIARQALAEADAAIEASRLEEGTAEEAMCRLIAELIDAGDRYRVLVYELFPPHRAKEMESRLGIPLFALAERGRLDGSFDPSLTPRWIIASMANLVMAAIQAVQEGEVARNHAAAIVAKTLLKGIAAPR